MTLLLLAVTVGLAVLLAIAATNYRAFPRLHPAPATSPQPNVSVLIPARNEAAVLAETLQRLATQDYANLEILVLDDGSEDSTPQIARQLAAQFPDLALGIEKAVE
ncbi:MAG: glycosyltransferase, partial [Caldilinea sp.]